MKKTLTEKEVKDIFNDDHKDYEEVEEQDWEDDGKYSFSSKIVKDKDGKFWMLHVNRSGSYFSHYEYDFDPEIFEVEQKEITRIEWIVKE